jgi:hypothetical protein
VLRAVRINIFLNRALVTDLWRSANGELLTLGHDIQPGSVLAALDRAASVMRLMLQQRGDDVRGVDKELDDLGALGLNPADPADWRRAAEILRRIVYGMGERLCAAEEDIVNVEIGDAGTPRGQPN